MEEQRSRARRERARVYTPALCIGTLFIGAFVFTMLWFFVIKTASPSTAQPPAIHPATNLPSALVATAMQTRGSWLTTSAAVQGMTALQVSSSFCIAVKKASGATDCNVLSDVQGNVSFSYFNATSALTSSTLTLALNAPARRRFLSSNDTAISAKVFGVSVQSTVVHVTNVTGAAIDIVGDAIVHDGTAFLYILSNGLMRDVPVDNFSRYGTSVYQVNSSGVARIVSHVYNTARQIAVRGASPLYIRNQTFCTFDSNSQCIGCTPICTFAQPLPSVAVWAPLDGTNSTFCSPRDCYGDTFGGMDVDAAGAVWVFDNTTLKKFAPAPSGALELSVDVGVAGSSLTVDAANKRVLFLDKCTQTVMQYDITAGGAATAFASYRGYWIELRPSAFPGGIMAIGYRLGDSLSVACTPEAHVVGEVDINIIVPLLVIMTYDTGFVGAFPYTVSTTPSLASIAFAHDGTVYVLDQPVEVGQWHTTENAPYPGPYATLRRLSLANV